MNKGEVCLYTGIALSITGLVFVGLPLMVAGAVWADKTLIK
jgi:uncharacterized membrane protein YqjE